MTSPGTRGNEIEVNSTDAIPSGRYPPTHHVDSNSDSEESKVSIAPRTSFHSVVPEGEFVKRPVPRYPSTKSKK